MKSVLVYSFFFFFYQYGESILRTHKWEVNSLTHLWPHFEWAEIQIHFFSKDINTLYMRPDSNRSRDH